MSDGVRTERIEDGIASESYRQKLSGNYAYANNDKTEGLFRIYGNKQRIALGSVINDHGLYAPYDMAQEFQYVLTLADNKDVLVANRKKNKAGEVTDELEPLGEYTLENLKLEYETIENRELFNEVNQQFQTGRSLVYEHRTHYTTMQIKAADTNVNINLNPPRKSMKAIVMLFKADINSAEQFVYPNIEKVNINIEGIPGSVWNHGLGKTRLFEEAKGVFAKDCIESIGVNPYSFFCENKFALVIDLRALS